jgi:sporulation integral membrane protein YlbJ
LNSRLSRLTSLMPGLLTLAAMGLVLAFPMRAQESARHTLLLCAQVVLPSLFPFFVLSALLTRSGVAQWLSRLLGPAVTLAFRLPPCCALPLLLGMISGYPVGAVTVAQLCEQGQCSRQDASRMLALCNNTGPAFVVSSVGAGLLGNPTLGWLLYGVHILSSLLCGALMSCFTPRPDSRQAPLCLPVTGSPLTLLVDSVTTSVHSILQVCGFILFFGIGVDLLDYAGLFRLAGNALSLLFPVDPMLLSRLLPGLLEVTAGVSGCSAFGATLSTLVLMEMMLSFGGLCVLAQVGSVVAPLELSLRPYLVGKTLTALLSGLLLYILLLLSPSLAQAFAWNDPFLELPGPLPMLQTYLALFAAAGTCLFLFSLFWQTLRRLLRR